MAPTYTNSAYRSGSRIFTRWICLKRKGSSLDVTTKLANQMTMTSYCMRRQLYDVELSKKNTISTRKLVFFFNEKATNNDLEMH